MVTELKQHLTALKGDLVDLQQAATCGRDSVCETSETHVSETTQFLHQLEEALKLLQKKAIFLSLVFFDNPSPPGLSDIAAGSTEQLKAATANLACKVQKKPQSAGKTLLHNWNLYLSGVFKDTVEFVSSVIAASSDAANGAEKLKTGIGKLCHTIECFAKLPKSNKSAAAICAQSALALVEDALEELTAPDFPIKSSAQADNMFGGSGDTPDDIAEELEEGVVITEEPEVPAEFLHLEQLLSDDEIRQLLQIAAGLVKTVRAVVKRAASALSDPAFDHVANNEPIDEIVESCNKMSPSCDEFVLALYPPRRARLLESEATDLSAAMRKLLAALVESGMAEENDKQLGILAKAIDHNSNKLISFLNAQTHG